MSKTKVINFGCRLNQYEGEIIKNISVINNNDSVIINTCTVTKNAEKEADKTIKQIKKLNPNAKIIVTGCAAQINPLKYATMPEVHQVLGNQDKLKKESYYSKKKIIVNPIEQKPIESIYQVTSMEYKTRMFLEIQNGCNHRCTFCCIPYARGDSRSIPPGPLMEQIKKMLSNNCKEIVLTGVDITSYGEDMPIQITLGSIVRKILKLFPELPRLRISSLDVAEIDDELIDVIKTESRFMPHIHISLQSGDNMILKRMKRRHNRERVINFCSDIKKYRKEITYGADLIVGFPTETDEMFRNSINLLKEINISNLHVFSFSAHEQTPASKMPQIDHNTIKQRSKEARAIGVDIKNKIYSNAIGQKFNVLVEDKKIKDNFCKGYTENFMNTKIYNNITKGTIAKVFITGYDGESLIGEPYETNSQI